MNALVLTEEARVHIMNFIVADQKLKGEIHIMNFMDLKRKLNRLLFGGNQMAPARPERLQHTKELGM
jgi:hypothetical protein